MCVYIYIYVYIIVHSSYEDTTATPMFCFNLSDPEENRCLKQNDSSIKWIVTDL